MLLFAFNILACDTDWRRVHECVSVVCMCVVIVIQETEVVLLHASCGTAGDNNKGSLDELGCIW